MAGSAATMAFLSLDCTVPVSLCVNTSRHQLWRIIERVYMCTESSDARNWFLSYFSASILGPVSLGKRWGSLNCPKVCSKDADPVCGSDGVIYTNDCELRKFTCKKSKFILMSTVYWHSSVVLHVSRLCFGSSRSDQGGLKPLYRSDERCQLHTQMYEKHRSGLWNKRKNIP